MNLLDRYLKDHDIILIINKGRFSRRIFGKIIEVGEGVAVSKGKAYTIMSMTKDEDWMIVENYAEFRKAVRR